MGEPRRRRVSEEGQEEVEFQATMRGESEYAAPPSATPTMRTPTAEGLDIVIAADTPMAPLEVLKVRVKGPVNPGAVALSQESKESYARENTPARPCAGVNEGKVYLAPPEEAWIETSMEVVVGRR